MSAETQKTGMTRIRLALDIRQKKPLVQKRATSGPRQGHVRASGLEAAGTRTGSELSHCHDLVVFFSELHLCWALSPCGNTEPRCAKDGTW